MDKLAVSIGETFGSPFGQTKSIGQLVSLILNIAFVIAGLLILVLFIFAGLQIIIGAGQNNPEAAKKGREAATAAALGFIIVFVAYWVIRIIETITGVLFITAPFSQG